MESELRKLGKLADDFVDLAVTSAATRPTWGGQLR